MPQGTLVGLGGLLRSGKDTVADHLVEQYGFVKMGMSDPLHEAMLKMNPFIFVEDEEFGIDGIYEKVSGPSATSMHFEALSAGGWLIRYSALSNHLGYVDAKKIKGYRKALQVFGTDVVRDMIDENAWVKLAQKRIQAELDKGNNVVMTALRFPNEVKLLAKMDGATLWIERPETGEEDAYTHSILQAHSSEKSVGSSDFQSHLINDGSLADLYEHVDMWIEDVAPDLIDKTAKKAVPDFDTELDDLLADL